MVFLELCPYVSHRFKLGSETVNELSRTDDGFQVASTLRKTLIGDANPALVLVNGIRAMEDFKRIHRKGLTWSDHSYPSIDRPSTTLWHKRGAYRTPSGAVVPVIGFPFLRKPKTHNSNNELQQLGASIAAFRSSLTNAKRIVSIPIDDSVSSHERITNGSGVTIDPPKHLPLYADGYSQAEFRRSQSEWFSSSSRSTRDVSQL